MVQGVQLAASRQEGKPQARAIEIAPVTGSSPAVLWNLVCWKGLAYIFELAHFRDLWGRASPPPVEPTFPVLFVVLFVAALLPCALQLQHPGLSEGLVQLRPVLEGDRGHALTVTFLFFFPLRQTLHSTHCTTALLLQPGNNSRTNLISLFLNGQ